MGIWNKKKNEINKEQEEQVTTSVIKAELDKSIEEAKPYQEQKEQKTEIKELSPKEKEIIALIKYYQENYGVFYGMGDIIQLPEAHIKAEQLNLLFGILCELKKLNEK